ncbi:hypothetical protein HXY33_02655 [Candidatus Bathyarchaeota archaeon]|nr:hypothetical protein [Candidatus Bathyarchaeota archaeon]
MNTKDFGDGTSVMRLAIFFSIFSAAFGIFLLYRLDNTIHGDLYNFGLQFDYNWALPTWTLERLLGVCLILPMVFGTIALVWDVRRSRNKELVVRRVEPKLLQQQSQQPRQQPPKQQPQPPPVSTSSTDDKAQALRENSMVISCPNCKKVFSKPLVMLDFSSKKTQLVNVCPYCNTVLGRACDEVEKDNIDIRTLDLDEKEEKSRR